jgi:hypothetical protein
MAEPPRGVLPLSKPKAEPIRYQPVSEPPQRHAVQLDGGKLHFSRLARNALYGVPRRIAQYF